VNTLDTADATGRAGEVLPEADSRARRPLVIAGVVGFLIGSGVLGVLWAASGTQISSGQDASAACAAFDRIGTLPGPTGNNTPLGASVLGPGVVHRMTAARELSAAAAEANPAYQALSDDIEGVNDMISNLRFSDPAGQHALSEVKQLCARF
jgi:hypothetical protein